MQVKQRSRGVKTAYKDLKSKIRDKTATSSTSSSRYSDHVTGHTDSLPRSAPNSPIFSKRPQTTGGSSDMYMNHYRKPSLQSTTGLLTDTSNNNSTSNNNHHAILFSKSPTISLQSSNSSSEMNLFEELQQHALFKTPAVDRSVSFFS